jgi:hypothetical protein
MGNAAAVEPAMATTLQKDLRWLVGPRDSQERWRRPKTRPDAGIWPPERDSAIRCR